MHAGKKQSRRMKGGMTTGQWGTAVYGGSDSQQAVGNGSNVIRMHDPNFVGAAPQMKGGRKLKGGDLGDYIPDIFASAPAAPPAAPPAEEKGILDKLSGLNPFADNNAAAAAESPPVVEESPPAVVAGGKGKRKSATKRRKSHKKKGKSSKKRAHKRH